jgi:hypothetical protein
MPFRSIAQDGVLTPDDLDFLQEIYDAATADISNVDDGMMHDVVKTLIWYYQAGERDRSKLIGLARQDLRRDVG